MACINRIGAHGLSRVRKRKAKEGLPVKRSRDGWAVRAHPVKRLGAGFPAIPASMLAFSGGAVGESRFLLGGGFRLVFRLPFLKGHAVDELACTLFVERNAALIGCILHPVGEAVAAKARQIHQVDVLHIGAIAQMGDEAAKGGGFQFQLCFGVDAHFCVSLNLASVAASAARLG